MKNIFSIEDLTVVRKIKDVIMPYAEKILILTPVKDAESFLDTHFENLTKITYPHENISLGFLESDSSDQTYSVIKEKLPGLRDLPNILKKIISRQYRGEIETEGLAIMANDMGYACWGMPNLEIKHR